MKTSDERRLGSATLLTEGESTPRVGNVVSGLSDLKFRTAVTPRMISSIYVLFIGAVLMFCVSLAVERSEPGVKNVVGLVLLVPAIFLGAIITARVVLEFVLTVFIVRDRVDDMRTSIESVPGLTDQMGELVDKIAVMAETISKLGDNMSDMTGKIGGLADQVSSITATIEKLDEQLPVIVENTTNIPGQIGALPKAQVKRGLNKLRGLGTDSNRDDGDVS